MGESHWQDKRWFGPLTLSTWKALKDAFADLHPSLGKDIRRKLT